jgi:exopolysaccharide production protein ExoY
MSGQLSNTQRPAIAGPVTPLYIGAVRVDRIFQQRARTSPVFRSQLCLKRGFDIVASALLIVIFSPLLLMSMLAVRLSSKGPMIFSQLRWGLKQRHFTCLKIRSMYLNQLDIPSPLYTSKIDRQGLLWKRKHDPRVTRIGAVLRRTSIDELPQLFNVLRGDMSIVGPRPLVLHMLDPFPEIRDVRCVVRPGITGLWQIRNRANNTSVMDMLADDSEYIASFNLLLDVKILLATPLVVLRGGGAH